VSVHRYETADGTRWQVRWREANGRVRTKSLTSKEAANAFDSDVKARKYKGEGLPRPGRETLASAYEEWWRLRGSTLASTTQRTYKAVWKAHVEDRFDHHRLNQLTADPQLFEELLAEMRERQVGNAAQRKVLVVISAVLTAAVEWKKIAVNPVWHLPKPPSTRQRHPHPFPPVLIERIRIRMQRRATKDDAGTRGVGDACLVSLLAYAGLRPGEALALTYDDVGTRSLLIDKAVGDGQEGPTKTGATRTVPLANALQEDIEAWCDCRTRHLTPEDLLFEGHTGRHWSRSEFNNWRNRVWKPVLKSLAAEKQMERLGKARPYDCRGSFVSLQLRAGASPLEVAKWAGHSPAVMFRHYAGVIDDLVGEPRLSAEDQINRARDIVSSASSSELDTILVDLMEHPTVAGAAGESAAHLVYAPRDHG
jgi:integrase